MSHNAGIDWQAIFSAFENGQHPPLAHGQAQTPGQPQPQQLAAQQAQAHTQTHPRGGDRHRYSAQRDSHQQSDSGNNHKEGEEGGGDEAAPGASPQLRRSESQSQSQSATGSGVFNTRTPATTASTSPGTTIASPALDTHRYHPAHAQAAAAAQAQAQALVAEAVARNAPIPDDLFAHFARANGFLPDAPSTASPLSNPGDQLSWAGPGPAGVNASPDLSARIALAEQFGYVPSPHSLSQQQAPGASPSNTLTLSHSHSLPTLAPRVLPGPSPVQERPAKRQASIAISPAAPAAGPSSGLPAGLPASITPSLSGSAGPSSAPTPLIDMEDVEDKRVRNTLASARFRAKKKQYIDTVERNIRDLENQHRDLEVEVNDLRKENGLLKDMVQLKYGGVRQ